MSSLKHSIRQQQAQLQNLENFVRVGPRPYPSDLREELNDNLDMYPPSSYTSSPRHVSSSSLSMSSSGPPPSSFVAPGSPSTSPTTSTAAFKMKRRSSYDVLHDLAGPDSNLPLPKRTDSSMGHHHDSENGVIREGVPFQNGSPQAKRAPSPTRTLSRIPISSVGNARLLADDSQNSVTPPRPSPTSKSISLDGHSNADTSTSSITAVASPSKRLSFTPGNTTKVLADLQTGVVNARNALEHTKSQLRLSQRTVSQLTRTTEDLKESRERLRLENEGLNNVVARKERLLQEVLERARKAEAEAAALKQQLKSETTTSKKTLREMEAALAESTALSSKSEREYITLRDSIKGMVESWKRDTDRLREEINKREAKWKAEGEKIAKDYKQLVQELKKAEKAREDLEKLKKQDEVKNKEVEQMWSDEIAKMREELEKSNQETDKAVKTAKVLEEELARLRRMMRSAGREAAEKEEQEKQDKPPS
ncbi:hypothetical protein CC1G_00789 [Coprinopsis cinerea okayama7|uniref:SWI5-dependent HO expression protein 3 n=1 Tax=Coprinopsis cinerea (strain Okayama-7 / 130 / ATCC MYA-4618 / FGSC 9003) TaxID=240176 RepID=A8N8R4_COPC7|nr:hypothetical protein CC1G_00789 [Coprinopsis cinerea okayama7\|eukprot:XP_001831242.2 hypothetical protein CC1G_00789 [Coprinopsis cinerea okayama7\